MVEIQKALWPNAARCAFAIRDDDVSAFTAPQMLQKLYAYTWLKGFAVTLSLIPMHKGSEDWAVPPRFRATDLFFPLSINRELVRFIRNGIKIRRIGIAQHGYAHEKLGDRGEFGIHDVPELSNRLKSGSEIIESCLGLKPKVFIAPWEDHSEETLFLLRNEGYVINVLEYSKSSDAPIPQWKNGLLNIPRDCPAFSFVESPSRTLLLALKRFFHLYQQQGCGVWVNHYWEFFYDWSTGISNRQLFQCWNTFIGMVSLFRNVWKVTLEELMGWWIKREQVSLRINEKTFKTIVTIETPVKIDGFTIAVKTTLFDSLKVDCDKRKLKPSRIERGLRYKTYYFIFPSVKPNEQTLIVIR